MNSLQRLEPKERHLVMDLLEKVGHEVSDWANFKGGASRAASNPKHCYEWAFRQGKSIVLNLWYENLERDGAQVFQYFNMRKRARRERKAIWKKRELRFDRAVLNAYWSALPIRVIICSGRLRRESTNRSEASSVKFRELDEVSWAVKWYDESTGDYLIQRGLTPIVPDTAAKIKEEVPEGFEGERKKRYIFYRTRERKLRNAKIAEALEKNHGRLICEVPNCGFDFADVYGKLGERYAEVHHKFALGKAPHTGRTNILDDLVIVCANCHSMIHRHGDCRPIEGLIK